jgi:hypothetical protein
MLLGPVPAAALIACAFALAGLGRRGTTQRRERSTDRDVVAVAFVALGWIALVAYMTAHGFSGNARYVMAPVALVCVLAGVGVARVAAVLQALIARARIGPALTAALASGLLAAGLVPFTFHNARELGSQVAQLEYQARMRTGLRSAIDRFGGPAAVRRCGLPVTEDYSVPMLAWYLQVHTSAVGLDAPAHGVVFRARPGPRSTLDPALGAGWHKRLRFRAGPYSVFTRCA